MGTQPGAQEKAQRCGFRKVSKPLMEKKRRARINVSLEQLKALLESHYSHHIRKRKLEKADILELSVKYLRSLQSSVQGADYQAGFRSCLHGVNQFLLRSEGARPSFPARLPQGSDSACRTTDSSPSAPLPELRGARPGGGGAAEQSPGGPGAHSSRTQPSAALWPGCPGEPGPSVASRSQALWRPW